DRPGTGRPPFTALGAGGLIGAHLYVAPAPPGKHIPGLSAETEKLILALLDKNPAKRPQTARELGTLLGDITRLRGWISPSTPSGLTAVRPTVDAQKPPKQDRPTAREEAVAPTLASDH